MKSSRIAIITSLVGVLISVGVMHVYGLPPNNGAATITATVHSDGPTTTVYTPDIRSPLLRPDGLAFGAGLVPPKCRYVTQRGVKQFSCQPNEYVIGGGGSCPNSISTSKPIDTTTFEVLCADGSAADQITIMCCDRTEFGVDGCSLVDGYPNAPTVACDDEHTAAVVSGATCVKGDSLMQLEARTAQMWIATCADPTTGVQSNPIAISAVCCAPQAASYFVLAEAGSGCKSTEFLVSGGGRCDTMATVTAAGLRGGPKASLIKQTLPDITGASPYTWSFQCVRDGSEAVPMDTAGICFGPP